jgi:hypothetical protein
MKISFIYDFAMLRDFFPFICDIADFLFNFLYWVIAARHLSLSRSTGRALKGILVSSGGEKHKMRRKMVKRQCSKMTMFENGKFAKPNCIMAKERNPSLRLTQLQISSSFLPIHLRCIYIH